MKMEGKTIRKQRLELGMSQLQLANEVGVSEQAIYTWEHDLSIPRRYNIYKLNQIFKLHQIHNPSPISNFDPYVNYSTFRQKRDGGEWVIVRVKGSSRGHTYSPIVFKKMTDRLIKENKTYEKMMKERSVDYANGH